MQRQHSTRLAMAIVFAAALTVTSAPPALAAPADPAGASCFGPKFGREVHSPTPRPVKGSLPGGDPRPGPDLLYAPLADAPQLRNTTPWQADPILVSGTSAYRRGEFLYQDFLYDDAGAGPYTYPTDPVYARNAADLVELRLKPLERGTAIRLTYNTMLNPDLAATTIALGDAAGVRPLPYGAGAQAPATVFVTVHGSTATITDAATGEPIAGTPPQVAVDTERRQVHVCVPYDAFDPRGQRSVRVAAGTGLWDQAGDKYLVPGAAPADATHPGGAGTLTNPPAFFNAAFRYDEPLSGFRTGRQLAVLRTNDLSPFFADVDFVKLAYGVNDDSGVPRTGYMNRILASHFESAQGRGAATTLQPDLCPAGGCQPPSYAGRLQPYEIYVPQTAAPRDGYGLMLNPHAAGGNHNSYAGGQSRWQQEIGERDTPYISVTPNARGTTYWYYGQAGAEVFEVWADVAHRYRLDPSRTMIGGLSMGGYATWKLAGQFPDLFAATPSIVPCPSAGVAYRQGGPVPGGEASLTRLSAPSFRNVPQLVWAGTQDTVCSYWAQTEYINQLDTLGYRYEFFSFPVGHAFPLGNEFQPMVDWMGTRQVVRDPAHVTYVMNGMMHEPGVGLNADHAYWLSGLKLRDAAAGPPTGTVDVFSHGFGRGDPAATPTHTESGQLQGATQPISYTMQSRDWEAAPKIPTRNRLDITATNITELTVNVDRARVSCKADLNVRSDGPIVVTLDGCGHKGRHVYPGGPA
ncbi:prolyl oligopeptidase family serine peptidase [Nonomuraea sp. M3C6]|uniref:Prolyl oligopeptidase family serine peptidase n=1 Tax=Nonomuraea marmarensis TaxID=3351344 RepID=A0ABW7AIS8_9ACTN